MTKFNFNDLVEPAAANQKIALRITVLGGGSFGTAMANLAVRNGCDTILGGGNRRIRESNTN